MIKSISSPLKERLSKVEIAQLVRDDRHRHAELADCELRAELDDKMAKPLQASIVDPLNASNQAVSASLYVTNLVP